MSNAKSWTIIDDTSPFIKFDNVWFDQSAIYPDKSAAGMDPYYNRTYITSNRDKAVAKVMFYGSKVSIYGTIRSK